MIFILVFSPLIELLSILISVPTFVILPSLPSMVKIQKLDITFDRESEVYWAGEKVSGEIILITSEDIKLNVVTFKVEGRGHVHWSEKWSEGDNSKTLHYVIERPFLSESVDLWGKRTLTGEPMPEWLAAGTYKYPFEFEIPEDSATSFEGEREGFVRYYVEVQVDIPLALDPKVRKHISIIGLMDLSRTELSQKGGRKTVVKEVSSGCYGSGSLEIRLSIPRLAYVPGEVIPITATVINDTKKRISATRAKLFQQTTFRAMLIHGDLGSDQEDRKGRKKKDPALSGLPQWQTQQSIPRLVTMAQNGTHVQPGATLSWTNEGLLIPAVPPKLGTCPEIEIGYFLEFEVDFGSISGSYPVQLPLIIGTIPKDTVHVPVGVAKDRRRHGMPLKAQLQPTSVLGAPEFESGHLNRGRHFTPMYPVYSVPVKKSPRPQTAVEPAPEPVHTPKESTNDVMPPIDDIEDVGNVAEILE